MAFADRYGFETQKTGTVSVHKAREAFRSGEPVGTQPAMAGIITPYEAPDRKRQYLEDLKDYLSTQLALVEQALSDI